MNTFTGEGVIFLRHGHIQVCNPAHQDGWLLRVTTRDFRVTIRAEDQRAAANYITRIVQFAEIIK